MKPKPTSLPLQRTSFIIVITIYKYFTISNSGGKKIRRFPIYSNLWFFQIATDTKEHMCPFSDDKTSEDTPEPKKCFVPYEKGF